MSASLQRRQVRAAKTRSLILDQEPLVVQGRDKKVFAIQFVTDRYKTGQEHLGSDVIYPRRVLQIHQQRSLINRKLAAQNGDVGVMFPGDRQQDVMPVNEQEFRVVEFKDGLP